MSVSISMSCISVRPLDTGQNIGSFGLHAVRSARPDLPSATQTDTNFGDVANTTEKAKRSVKGSETSFRRKAAKLNCRKGDQDHISTANDEGAGDR